MMFSNCTYVFASIYSQAKSYLIGRVCNRKLQFSQYISDQNCRDGLSRFFFKHETPTPEFCQSKNQWFKIAEIHSNFLKLSVCK